MARMMANKTYFLLNQAVFTPDESSVSRSCMGFIWRIDVLHLPHLSLVIWRWTEPSPYVNK